MKCNCDLPQITQVSQRSTFVGTVNTVIIEHVRLSKQTLAHCMYVHRGWVINYVSIGDNVYIFQCYMQSYFLNYLTNEYINIYHLMYQ